MEQYRLFFIKNSSGRIERAEIVEAWDDRQAIEACAPRAVDQPLELWCRARRIRRFEPIAVSASQSLVR